LICSRYEFSVSRRYLHVCGFHVEESEATGDLQKSGVVGVKSGETFFSMAGNNILVGKNFARLSAF